MCHSKHKALRYIYIKLIFKYVKSHFLDIFSQLGQDKEISLTFSHLVTFFTTFGSGLFSQIVTN